MSFHHGYQGDFAPQGTLGFSVTLAAFSALGACVPYPHSVTRNAAIEGRVLSAETGLGVAGATIELQVRSDASWVSETLSDSAGRFAFAERRDHRLMAQLADAPRCLTALSVSAPGYHTRRCGWISLQGCSSEPMKLPRLLLQPEHLAEREEEMPDSLWQCTESAMEKAR